MLYIPKYVRQESDLEYGEKVTHENYNEKLNLNTTQGDYNTEVLNALFNNEDIESTYHIPYLDNALTAQSDRIESVEQSQSGLEHSFELLDNRVDNIGVHVAHIITGVKTVGHARTAERLKGDATAGPSKYYGTNDQGRAGFYPLPEFIYAEEMSSIAGVDGLYYVPMLNSVAENMLTEEVRTKLNNVGITDYDLLENRPQINSVTLTGNVALADLGIQAVGDYVTTTDLTTTLGDYYTATATDTAIGTATTDMATQTWVTNQLADYATTASVSAIATTANNAAVVQVGSSFVGTPKDGDLLISLT